MKRVIMTDGAHMTPSEFLDSFNLTVSYCTCIVLNVFYCNVENSLFLAG